MERWKTQTTSAAAVEDSAGGERAFEESLVACRPRLFRSALLMLGAREEAEDATQKALLRALRSRGSFRREAEVYTWAYRILLNVCKDLYKARARAGRHFGPLTDHVAQAEPVPGPTMVEKLEARERDQCVRRALDALDPRMREVIVLRHYDEMSYEEIARVLGCPIGTVRSRLSAAREKLRVRMEEEGVASVKISDSDAACAEARARFSEAIDDALSARDRGTLGAHLSQCSGCASAYSDYARDLQAVGPSLRRLIDAEGPRLPFPQEPEPGLGRIFSPLWLRPAALGIAAVLGLILGLRLPAIIPGPETERGSMARAVGASGAESGDGMAPCPWREASVGEVERAVSYPVVATECLDHDFELVEASVIRGKPCGENLRLTYRAGARSFVLEQHPGSGPQPCTGEHVSLGELAGCFDRAVAGTTSLRWSHDDQLFHLKGDVAPAEAIVVARAISQDFDRP